MEHEKSLPQEVSLSDQVADALPEISDWLRANAIPFDTAEPGSGFDDLMFLKGIIGSARIVALGEATHGTHEFFQMKHRMLEFLVKEMRFNVFAIEASWPESNLVNDYVLTGQGDPAALLAGLGFWVWDTQEVLDLIRWMSAHNEHPGAAPPVSFYGFDMQFPWLAMSNVVKYLRQVDPEAAPRVAAFYDGFRVYKHTKRETYANLAAEAQSECRDNLQAVYDWLSQHQIDYEARSSSEAFALALQSARVVLQAEDVFREEDRTARDRYMAENVAWLLDQASPDAKMVLWAHNDHVGVVPGKTMGACLRERYGDEMVVFGFSFYRGAFNAIRQDDSGKIVGGFYPKEFQVTLPPEGSTEYYFRSAELPRFFLNLRGIQVGSSVTDWLLVPRPFRSIGAGYNDSNPPTNFRTAVLPQEFDALIYFQDTTPSLLLGQVLASSKMPPVQPVDTQPFNLDFEAGTSGWVLRGSHPQDYEIGSDSTIAHGGDASGYIWSAKDRIDGFGTLMQMVSAREYRGRRLCMSAYVKTEGVEGWAGLWMRVDTSTRVGAFDNMQDRPILCSTDWARYEIVLDIPEDSINIAFGILLTGTGRAWVDDFQFEIVGQDMPTTG